MSDEEINKLASEEQELEKKLREIQAKKRMLIENMPLTLSISVQLGIIVVHSNRFRSDFVNEFKSFRSRIYNPLDKSNEFPYEDDYALFQKLDQLTDKTVVISDPYWAFVYEFLYTQALKEEEDRQVKKELENQPEFLIGLNDDKERITIKTKSAQSYLLNTLWGLTTARNYYTIPLVEGYRLYALMQNMDQKLVKWEQEAFEIVKKDVEKRAYLDDLAKREDSEFDVQFLPPHKLRPRQKVALEFQVATGGHCIVGDTMGVGKTWEWIALCEYLKAEMSLMVCPANLRINWEREIFKLTGERPFVLTGLTPTILDTMILLRKRPKYVLANYTILGKTVELDKLKVNTEGGEVTVTEKKQQWVDVLNLVKFDVIGADEGHYAKNVDSDRSKALRKLEGKHKIVLTGTPVVNRPGEFWPALNWIAPKLFPSFENFLDTYTIDGGACRNTEHLRDTLRTLMIRRTLKDVHKDLPPINRIQHFHELTPKGKKVYEKAKKWVFEVMQEWNPGEAGAEKQITSLLTQIQRLKQIVSIDKSSTVADLAIQIHDSYQNAEDQANGEGKVIIFSQFKPTVRRISTLLADSGCLVITGDLTLPERMKLVDQFQTDPKIRFLVGTWQSMGEGLTLTAASFIIFADLFWAPGHHQQSESRAYGRMNDLHSVTSYYVIAEKTIEEWIQELLAAKLNIIESLVEGRDDPQESVAKKLLERMKKEFHL